MTKRDVALTIAKSAGFHNDTRTFTRAIIERRVNREAMNAAWAAGVAARNSGGRCQCYECSKA